MLKRVRENPRTTTTGAVLGASMALAGYLSGQGGVWPYIIGLATALVGAYAKDPSATKKVIKGLIPVVALCVTPGCAAIRGASATVTVDGQTVTVTVEKDGAGACTSYEPPITYMGETCSEICSAKTFPFINATCNSVTGVRHTVALVRVSP